MKRDVKISDAEWQVMEIIWQNKKIRAYDVVKDLENISTWSSKTIRTLIKRLVDKGVVGVEKEKFNMYFPLKTKEQCVKEETNRFLNKIYNGSLGLLVASFAKTNKLSDQDISALKDLLEEQK
ncbi:BlaI/MecI/CopY family transcriptional regulator [Clostridium sp. 'deep sea']|uniref:BlaI/MecI/CopY family transcriptional regulator n=1 Tax=Clostridium sp. 'deep sea' TaxID=2779445 RepID=UPI0018964438|nr:BlaI/MecI/CopY family transcriptional regulator [Clostridium sp. 'deep sea']QOR35265.1 BlaI/MecI/CopY family transcriptional regulator [Clostridium sp. 'deep sea']